MTVQPKAIAHPTDHRLLWKAIEKLTKMAKREGVIIRQSYRRVSKRACIMAGRYIHAKQFKRARRELSFLTRLGRAIRTSVVRLTVTAPLRASSMIF